MEQLDDQLAHAAGTSDVRRRFQDVMGPPDGAPPIDVRAYLLDPPPTPEQVHRLEQRRTLVRRLSLAGCAVLGIVLLAPVPGGDDEPAQAPAPVVAETQEPAAVAPVRVDVPAARPAARARPRRARPHPAVVHAPTIAPARAAAPTPEPAAPAPAPASPAPTPLPPPSPDAGVLVPVI